MNAYIASFMLLLFNAVGLAVPAVAATAESRIADEAAPAGMAVPAKVPAAVEPQSGALFDKTLQEWRLRVATAAQAFYPHLALAEGLEGLSKIRFRLTETGSVDQCWIEQSSGHAVLDNQACKLVQTVRPAPVAADEAGRAKSAWVVLPVRWRLADIREAEGQHIQGAP